MGYSDIYYTTLPETNIFAPENRWLEYLAYFQGRPVSFREGSLEKNSVQLVFLPLCFQTFGKHAPKAGGELEARLFFFPERGMVQ